MPKYIIVRTVEITLELEADNPKEAMQAYYQDELEGEFDEQSVEMWDVTNDDLHQRICNSEFEDQ